MKRWSEFEAAAPELAAEGRKLLFQYPVGLGYLATVRRDGGPRVHPVCPLVADGGLYLFVIKSPKRGDLRRDGRYALHSFPAPDRDDEFYLTGSVRRIEDMETRTAVTAAYHAPVADDHDLFELLIERALFTKYRHRGDFSPTRTVWPGSARDQRDAIDTSA